MSDPRAGGWGRGAEPPPSPPPAQPEAPGPRPRARGAAARPPARRAAPEMRLRPPGYVTRDLRFPRHPALRRAPTRAPARGPASESRRRCRKSPVPPAPASGQPFIPSRVRASAPPAFAGRGSGTPRPAPRFSAFLRRTDFSLCLALWHPGGSVFFTPFPLSLICPLHVQDTCPQVSVQVLSSHLGVLLK